MTRLLKRIGRTQFASCLLILLMGIQADAAGLPTNEEEAVSQIRTAIETSDYEALKEIVLWKGTGKIKKRIVRFELNRSLGRKVKKIEVADLPPTAFDKIIASGRLKPNMQVTRIVKVIFDEEPINAEGKLPTSVFLIGKENGVYRIGLVNRAAFDDDDD